jgi:hypothetical protein
MAVCFPICPCVKAIISLTRHLLPYCKRFLLKTQPRAKRGFAASHHSRLCLPLPRLLFAVTDNKKHALVGNGKRGKNKDIRPGYAPHD